MTDWQPIERAQMLRETVQQLAQDYSGHFARWNKHSNRILAVADDLERLGPTCDWQPIETAPKDGTTIIGWDRYHLEAATYRWETGGQFDGWSPVHEQSAVIEAQGDWGTDYKDHAPLSHWMPLPTPPNTEEG